MVYYQLIPFAKIGQYSFDIRLSWQIVLHVSYPMRRRMEIIILDAVVRVAAHRLMGT